MLILVVCFGALSGSCSSTHPVVKIGLVAPFEGLYRRSGYEALAAVRMAVADAAASNVEVIPLALDGGADMGQSQRAMQKVLADPAVRAVIGPLDPSLAAAVSPIVSGTGVLWLSPLYVASSGGFSTLSEPDGDFWATELVRAVAVASQAQGAQRMILAGRMDGWPSLTDEQWSNLAGLPVEIVGAAELSASEDDERTAVLHLGPPDVAAEALRDLRAAGSAATFWLGPAGGDPVFFERAKPAETIHWAVWSDPGYNGWAKTHAPATPFAYLVYLAARQAIDTVTEMPNADDAMWHVQFHAIGANGVSQPVTLD